MNFDEILENLKLKPLTWYNRNVPDEYKEIANDLYKIHNFFAQRNSPFVKDVDNHVLNILLLLRQMLSEEKKDN